MCQRQAWYIFSLKTKAVAFQHYKTPKQTKSHHVNPTSIHQTLHCQQTQVYLFAVLMSTGSSPVWTSTLMVAFTSPVFRMLAGTLGAGSGVPSEAASSSGSSVSEWPAAAGSPDSSFTRLLSPSSGEPAGPGGSRSSARFWLRVRRAASSDIAAPSLWKQDQLGYWLGLHSDSPPPRLLTPFENSTIRG